MSKAGESIIEGLREAVGHMEGRVALKAHRVFVPDVNVREIRVNFHDLWTPS